MLSFASMRAWLLILGVGLFGGSRGYAQPTDTLHLTLIQTLQRALEVSPDLQAIEARQHFAQARYEQARASRLLTQFQLQTAHAIGPGLKIPENNAFPSDALYLNPNVRNDWRNVRPLNQLEVQLIQPLWTWGELSGQVRAARYGVEVATASTRQKALEVAARTGELYFSLQLTEALLRLARETGEILERAKAEVNRLLQEGDPTVDDADLFQLRITEQEYLQRVVEAEEQHQIARSALARQLLLPEGTVIEPAEGGLAPLAFTLDALETYLERAETYRPEIQQARAGLAAREALVEVARSDYYPKLFLGIFGRWTYTAGRYRQPNPYISDPYFGESLRAGLGLRLNLNFGQTRARVAQARAQRNEVAHQLEAARQLVRFEVEEAYRNVRIAQAALEARDRALTISKEWLRTEQINFDLDLGDTENLVRAVRENLELQARYYEAVYNYNRAVLRLQRAVGVLDLNVRRGTLVE
ncbi:Outer membrane protein TolC [Rhodothermus profundi]|uniref:Outer membrane protein TolC n=2 Tax=Rhodothermus profundi TaxID=633813 RepID=A0A1M6RGC1_9BACT|nr:Outer membrane protein TolC [Rhodothermus profundi]